VTFSHLHSHGINGQGGDGGLGPSGLSPSPSASTDGQLVPTQEQERTRACSVGSDHPSGDPSTDTGDWSDWKGRQEEWLGCAGAEGHGQDRRGKGIAAIPGACRKGR